PVYLAGAHPHPLAVDRGVRATVDHRAAPRRDPNPVSVAPDFRIHREVALPQPRPDAVAIPQLAIAPRLIPPETTRHRGHRLRDPELADLVDHAPSLFVPRLHRAAKDTALQFALVDRQERAAADERRADVRAPARRVQPDVRSDVAVDPAEA